MQTKTIHPTASVFRLNRAFLTAIISLFILLVAFFAFHVFAPSSTAAPLSQSALKAKYGLRVSLIAVTAAGGKVDLRLRMVDAAKARLLLQDSKNYPALVTENGVVLSIPIDEKSENIDFKDNSNLYLLFPNTGGAIQQGATVTIRFGETSLEPLKVK